MLLGKPWAGVISCCGGWPEQMPADTLPKDLAVFVTAGLYDFNYWPSRDIGTALDAAGVANHLQMFRTGTPGCRPRTAMDAVSWLELQAMKKGLRARDDGLDRRPVRGLLLRRVREIEEARKTGRGV